MTSFDDRERAYENRFAHDEEVKFRITSRRRKLLGLWAADEMDLSDEDSLKYAMEIVSFGIEDTSSGAVIKKIVSDAKKHGRELTEATVKAKNSEFEVIATKQIINEKR